jgi:hypothetical protein
VIQRRAMVGIAGAAAMMLSACGFDSPAVTATEHSSIQGQNFQVGPILVRNVYVTSLQTSAASATSYVGVTLVNPGTQGETLTAISSPEGSVALTGAGVFGGSLTVPPNSKAVILTQPLLTPTGPTATFTASSTPQLGTYIPMQFTFGTAGTSASEPIPVIPPTGTTAVSSPIPQESPATFPPQTGENASD